VFVSKKILQYSQKIIFWAVFSKNSHLTSVLIFKHIALWQCFCRVCVACSLCSHVWKVTAHWKMSVVCLIRLSGGTSKLSIAVSHFEQIANIKFIQKLGKSAAEMLQALQFVFGDSALKKQLCRTGTATSRVGQNCWKKSLRVGGLQLV
jgi:hypothetical protein